MTFDMSAAWRDATTMMGGNREVLMIVGGLFFFLPAVATGFIVPAVPQVAWEDPQRMQAVLVGHYVSYGWALILVALLQLLGSLTLLVLLRDRKRPTVGEALAAGAKGMLPAIGAMLLAGLAIGALVIALTLMITLLAASLGAVGGFAAALVLFAALVLVIVASIKLTLVTPVIAVDQVHNPVTALRRSWKLTRGQVLRLFAFFLLLMLAYLVISIVIGLIIGALGLALGEVTSLIVGNLLAGLVGAAAVVITVAVTAAIHRQLAGPWSRGEEIRF